MLKEWNIKTRENSLRTFGGSMLLFTGGNFYFIYIYSKKIWPEGKKIEISIE